MGSLEGVILDKTQLAERFKTFAFKECKGSSNLYEYLSLKIAEDEEMLEISYNVRVGQPVPNLFLGAVHYLLLKGKEHELKQYYASIVGPPKEVERSFTHFKDFCRLYREEIISILKTKLVQTNEVRRCAYLYPIFCFIYNKLKNPLSLVEIGSSAGLQLLWDRYCYSYGTSEVFGEKDSSVHITAEIKGDNFPFLLPSSPPVAIRIGLDLHTNDLSNPDDYLWLKSLIWPEHRQRVQLFENAANCYNQQPAKLIQGDGIDLLIEIADAIPKESTLCIFHTHVANQIPTDEKNKLIENIKTIAKDRDVFHIYNNMWDRKLHLDYFISGVEYKEIIGETDGHGRWFSWELKK